MDSYVDNYAGPSTSKRPKFDNPPPASNVEVLEQEVYENPEEEEVYDEVAVGEVVRGEDGSLFLMLHDGELEGGLEDVDTIRVTANQDGTETVTLDKPPGPPDAEGDAKIGAYSARQRINSNRMPLQDGHVEVVAYDSDYLLPQGRRNRVYGQCRCPECGQSFINTARLERHLAVHQIFGSYLCPLCGKTYKYEYNLFYHWRRTCRDMNENLSVDQRQTMEVNALRQLVEELAQKKAEYGAVDVTNIGISGQQLYRNTHLDKLEPPGAASWGRRGASCPACGITIMEAHVPGHLAVHRGERPVDERDVGGAYFCDLCGLMFRHHQNLIKHWRTGCPEIQANLPPNRDLTLDENALKELVKSLLKSACMNPALPESPAIGARVHEVLPIRASGQSAVEKARQLDSLTADLNEVPPSNPDLAGRDASGAGGSTDRPPAVFDEKWAEEQGIIFADDYYVDEGETLTTYEDGRVHPMGAVGQNRSKWLMGGQAVQCSECHRTFANPGRLERHLAGSHSSFGAHHCILCGNRFKYDYNLLYHYRRSCPYTKVLVERDVREQLDATSLRKLVRTLSTRDLRLTAHMQPPPPRMHHKQELGDAFVRKQMMRSVMPPNQLLPPQLLLPSRPDLPDGEQCPVCSIVFYGMTVLRRHMRAAHPVEFLNWVDQLAERERQEGASREGGEKEAEREGGNKKASSGEGPESGADANKELQREQQQQREPEPMESPPRLEPEPEAINGELQPRVIDENGILLEGVDADDVQRMIDTGELQLKDPGQIVVVHQQENGILVSLLPESAQLQEVVEHDAPGSSHDYYGQPRHIAQEEIEGQALYEEHEMEEIIDVSQYPSTSSMSQTQQPARGHGSPQYGAGGYRQRNSDDRTVAAILADMKQDVGGADSGVNQPPSTSTQPPSPLRRSVRTRMTVWKSDVIN
ncbi:Zinc fingerC2H2 type family protein [Aphelenchoides avenae]|nr:Zinc fingerC2H2 type family protein [Aphelenchus avenae]